eukprot:211639-Amphidinium_carterae.4
MSQSEGQRATPATGNVGISNMDMSEGMAVESEEASRGMKRAASLPIEQLSGQQHVARESAGHPRLER